MIYEPLSRQYIVSVYWSFMTLTTVGYGVPNAQTPIEIIFTLLWMIFGVGFYSFTIGNLSSILSSIDEKASELQKKKYNFSEYAKKHKLPIEIQNKVTKFIDNNQRNYLEQMGQ